MSATATLPPSALVGRKDPLWPTVIASLALHAAFIGLVLWKVPAPPLDLDQKPIVARLVRLGEVRPKELLPRKEAPPPPGPVAAAPPAPTPAPPPKVAEAPRPDAMAPPKPAPAKPAPAAPARAQGGGLASALSRIEREQKAHGSPDGHPLGDAEEGEAGDQYLALVTRALQETYVLPATISDQERLHLRATVILYIEPDGRISRHAFEARSGNAVFDAALERAIQGARLPPPPAEVRQRYRSQGLAVLYRP